MEAPLTPTSALLYTYLELDAFNTPGSVVVTKGSKEIPYAEEDVFAQAFGNHDNVDAPLPRQSAQNPLQHNAILQPTATTYQSIYMSPPLSTNAAEESSSIDVPALELSSKKNSIASMSESSDCVLPSDLPSYLAHVFSSKSSDDFFSYAQKNHNEILHGQTSDQAMFEKENLPHEIAIYAEDFPHTLPRKTETSGSRHLPLGTFYDGQPQQQHITPYSLRPEPTISGTAPASPSIKPKKTRRRRSNRSAEEEARRHQAFLERNRKAAGKCRSRKKDRVQKLVEDVDQARATNGALKAEREALIEEVRGLRRLLGDGSCACMSAGQGYRMETGEKAGSVRKAIEMQESRHCAEESENHTSKAEVESKLGMSADLEIAMDLEMDGLEMGLDEVQEGTVVKEMMLAEDMTDGIKEDL